MKKNNLKYFLALLIIFNLSFAATCGKTGNPQADDKLRTIVRTEDDISQGLKSTANVLKSAKDTNALSQEDLDFLKPILKSVGDSNLEAIKISRFMDAQGNLPADKQQQLLDVISFTSDQLVQLNNEGTLRIKDKNKRLIFTTVVLTLQASVTSLVPLLTKGK